MFQSFFNRNCEWAHLFHVGANLWLFGRGNSRHTISTCNHMLLLICLRLENCFCITMTKIFSFILICTCLWPQLSLAGSSSQDRLQLTRDSFAIVIGSYLDEGYSNYLIKPEGREELTDEVKSNDEELESVEVFNSDFYTRKYYLESLLSEWQFEINRGHFQSTQSLIENLMQKNKFLGGHQEIWQSLIGLSQRLNLGHTRSKALYEALQSEKIINLENRLVKLIEITNQWLLVNSRDYYSTNVFSEIFALSKKPQVRAKALNLKSLIPLAKKVHIFNDVKNFYAYSFGSGLGQALNGTSKLVVSNVKRIGSGFSKIQRAALVSASIHGLALIGYNKYSVKTEALAENEKEGVLKALHQAAFYTVPI